MTAPIEADRTVGSNPFSSAARYVTASVRVVDGGFPAG